MFTAESICCNIGLQLILASALSLCYDQGMLSFTNPYIQKVGEGNAKIFPDLRCSFRYEKLNISIESHSILLRQGYDEKKGQVIVPLKKLFIAYYYDGCKVLQ